MNDPFMKPDVLNAPFKIEDNFFLASHYDQETKDWLLGVRPGQSESHLYGYFIPQYDLFQCAPTGSKAVYEHKDHAFLELKKYLKNELFKTGHNPFLGIPKITLSDDNVKRAVKLSKKFLELEFDKFKATDEYVPKSDYSISFIAGRSSGVYTIRGKFCFAEISITYDVRFPTKTRGECAKLVYPDSLFFSEILII